MTKNTKQFITYLIAGIFTLGLVFVGSLDKTNADTALSLSAFAANGYKVSTDQLTELYVVADLSNAMNLASANDVASNYVITTTMYAAGQTSSGKLEKEHLVDTSSLSRGIITYTVEGDESMADIAARFGLTTDQIRWSNNLKTTSISDGDVLYLPSTPGIIYVVKDDDSLESIANTYGSTVAEIIALNDLEVSGISEGMRIVIKNGTLPEKERPEYVAPVVTPVRYTYSYLGNTSERQGIEVIGYNYYGGGQCVGYAAWYRNVSGRSPLSPIPENWGNANTWAYAAAADGYTVNRTPEVGAIFQTPNGYYGHVGVVVGINSDGSIVVEEANYNYVAGRITRSTIPASAVGNFNYIH